MDKVFVGKRFATMNIRPERGAPAEVDKKPPSQEKISEIKKDHGFWDDFLARNEWANQELETHGNKDEALAELYGVYEKEKKLKSEVRWLFEREAGKLIEQTGLIIPEEAFQKLDEEIETQTRTPEGVEKISEIVEELETLAKLEKEREAREKKLNDTLALFEGKILGAEQALGWWKTIQETEGIFSPSNFLYRFFKTEKQQEAAERVEFFTGLLNEGATLAWQRQTYDQDCLALLNDSLKLTSAFEVVNKAHNQVLAEYMTPAASKSGSEEEEYQRKNVPEAFKLFGKLKEWRERHPSLEVAIDEEKIWKAVHDEAKMSVKKEMEKLHEKEIKEVGHTELMKNLENIINKAGEDKAAKKAIRIQVISQLEKLLKTNLKPNKKSLVRVVIADLKKT